MSRAIDGGPDYPLRFTNTSGETVPPFALLNLGDALLLGQEKLPGADTATSSPGDALYVNGPASIPNGDEGHCRSVFDGPFWVAIHPDDAPAAGDTAGSGDGLWHIATGGDPLFLVHYVDADKNIALCSYTGSSAQFAWFFMTERLEECGESAAGRMLGFSVSGPGCYPVTPVENYLEAAQAFDTVDICPWLGWRGVAFEGDVPTTGMNGCEVADVVLARKIGSVWYAVGSGHTSLFGIAGEDIAENATGSATAYHKHGLCDIYPGFNQCHSQSVENYRESQVTVRANGGPITAGDKIELHWSGTEWFATQASVAAGCGLELDDDTGEIRVASTIAGERLSWNEDACAIDADPITCDDLSDCIPCASTVCDRITALEECCDTLTEIINDLIECCEENRECCEEMRECCDDNRQCCEESLLCCYDNREAIDYIGEYCCDGGLDDGGGGCKGKCVWRWLGASWENIVPCAGDDCDCAPPEGDGQFVGDLEFTECVDTGGGGGGECGTCTHQWTAGFWVYVDDDCGVPPGDCDHECPDPSSFPDGTMEGETREDNCVPV